MFRKMSVGLIVFLVLLNIAFSFLLGVLGGFLVSIGEKEPNVGAMVLFGCAFFALGFVGIILVGMFSELCKDVHSIKLMMMKSTGYVEEPKKSRYTMSYPTYPNGEYGAPASNGYGNMNYNSAGMGNMPYPEAPAQEAGMLSRAAAGQSTENSSTGWYCRFCGYANKGVRRSGAICESCGKQI